MQHARPRPDDINERALVFVCRVVEFTATMPARAGTARVVDQLVGAAGGIGSNLEEASAASTRREFVRFNEIALRESREAVFWLRVCRQSGLAHQDCGDLLDEAQQIARIIATIIINTKNKGL
jgi:four helix bundle protein